MSGLRYISWIWTLPVAAIAISFAVSNREMAAVGLWPFEGQIMVPAYVLVLVPLAVGLILGCLIAWLSGGRWRRRARQSEHRVAVLEHEVEALQTRLAKAGRAAEPGTEPASGPGSGRAVVAAEAR